MAEKTICLKTERLYIVPMTIDELKAQIAQEKNDELKAAYQEMLDGCNEEPDYLLWYIPWKIILKDSELAIGDAAFKGPQNKGIVEIGYGILSSQQKHGYMTEALSALTDWAFSQKDVYVVTAETAPGNKASQLVLEKNGFVMYANGKEGPRYKIAKRTHIKTFIYIPVGVIAGALIGFALDALIPGTVIGFVAGGLFGVLMDVFEYNRRMHVTAERA